MSPDTPKRWQITLEVALGTVVFLSMGLGICANASRFPFDLAWPYYWLSSVPFGIAVGILVGWHFGASQGAKVWAVAGAVWAPFLVWYAAYIFDFFERLF